MRITRVVAALTVAVAALGLTACDNGQHPSSSPNVQQTTTWPASPAASAGSSAAPEASTSATPAPGASAAPGAGTAAAAPIGAQCDLVPSGGPGSFADMAGAPVVTAASHNPRLTTFASLVRQANLANTLNGARDITVFVPSNAAFAQVPPARMTGLANNKAALAAFVNNHVVGQPLTPAQLASGEFKTLGGATLTTTGSGQNVIVNGAANVTCGNVRTANATVYIVDAVQLPTS